jgi:hypothetical protein
VNSQLNVRRVIDVNVLCTIDINSACAGIWTDHEIARIKHGRGLAVGVIFFDTLLNEYGSAFETIHQFFLILLLNLGEGLNPLLPLFL